MSAHSGLKRHQQLFQTKKPMRFAKGFKESFLTVQNYRIIYSALPPCSLYLSSAHTQNS